MSFDSEYTWFVKPETGLIEADLEIGRVYKFSTTAKRPYPTVVPIDLVNDKSEAIAKIVVLEFENDQGVVTGTYRIIKLYNQQEKEQVTRRLMLNKE